MIQVKTGFAVIRPSKLGLPDFLSQAILNGGFIDAIQAHSKGISYPAINSSELVDLYIALPMNIAEQADIVAYIKNQTSKLDKLMDKTNKSVELLKEHRTALISAAVTGKIDVRNHVGSASNNLEVA